MDRRPLALSDVIVALVNDGHCVALILGGARTWDGSFGEAFASLALPSSPAAPDARAEQALAIGGRALGLRLALSPAPWTYGPSARHAMDRVSASDGAPFLAYQRFDAPDDAGAGPRRTSVRVYRARATGLTNGSGERDVVWAPPAAMRAALGGVWLKELLAMTGVRLAPATSQRLAMTPASTLVYLPAITGERQLLRACAKYGDNILFDAPHEHEAE